MLALLGCRQGGEEVASSETHDAVACSMAVDSHQTAPHEASMLSIFILFLEMFFFSFFPNGHHLAMRLKTLNLV